MHRSLGWLWQKKKKQQPLPGSRRGLSLIPKIAFSRALFSPPSFIYQRPLTQSAIMAGCRETDVYWLNMPGWLYYGPFSAEKAQEKLRGRKKKKKSWSERKKLTKGRPVMSFDCCNCSSGVNLPSSSFFFFFRSFKCNVGLILAKLLQALVYREDQQEEISLKKKKRPLKGL